MRNRERKKEKEKEKEKRSKEEPFDALGFDFEVMSFGLFLSELCPHVQIVVC